MDTRCKNCGAPLFFNTRNYDVFCKSCDSTFHTLNEKSEIKTSEKECVYCGAQFQGNENDTVITQKCPFCKQKSIIDRRVSEYRGFVILPYKYYYDEAKTILLKKIPITRNKKYIKRILEDASESIYVPFHAYNLYIQGTFTWECSETEEVEDGVDSKGNKKYKTVTHRWTETITVSNDFKNASTVSTTIRQDAFKLNKRSYKKLTFKKEDLELHESKYFLMSKYAYQSNRSDNDTFQDFIDYAYYVLKDKSRPAHGDYVRDYSLNYNPFLVNRNRYEVLIPFYFYQDPKESKYYCYVNANNGEVKYKCPLNLIFILSMIFLGIIVITAIALFIRFYVTN